MEMSYKFNNKKVVKKQYILEIINNAPVMKGKINVSLIISNIIDRNLHKKYFSFSKPELVGKRYGIAFISKNSLIELLARILAEGDFKNNYKEIVLISSYIKTKEKRHDGLFHKQKGYYWDLSQYIKKGYFDDITENIVNEDTKESSLNIDAIFERIANIL